MEDVNERRRISYSLSKLECGFQEINSREIRLHLPFSPNWNKRDKDWKKREFRPPVGSLHSTIFFLFDPVFAFFSTAEPGPRLIEFRWTGQEARRRANSKRGPRCIMPLARKLDMTEFKGVSYFPRYGIILYAVNIVKLWQEREWENELDHSLLTLTTHFSYVGQLL